MEDWGKNRDPYFINEVEINQYTIPEIMVTLWKAKKVRHTVPVLIYVLAVLFPMGYGFVTGQLAFTLLAAFILLGGLVAIFVYLGVDAVLEAKKQRKKIRQITGQYGKEAVLKSRMEENIQYSFHGMEKIVDYSEIKRIINKDNYIILKLKNGKYLPIRKQGFVIGEEENFMAFLKQKCKK